MKKIVLGTFTSSMEAGKFIGHIKSDLDIVNDDISYVYRNTEGDIKEADGEGTVTEGATKGALVGGSVGAVAGMATVAGLIPVIGPIFAAGTIVTALGLGAGAVATTAAGALTGAMAGGVIGALVNVGASEIEAKEYETRINAGDILVMVETENEQAVQTAFTEHGASSVHSYTTQS